MHEPSWYWITLELTVTPVLGLLMAAPFWRKGGRLSLSLVVESRLRRRDYSPEWR